jgi:hypothetical protein
VGRVQQRNDAMASVLDENEAGLLRLRVQHADMAELHTTLARSMDLVQVRGVTEPGGRWALSLQAL